MKNAILLPVLLLTSLMFQSAYGQWVFTDGPSAGENYYLTSTDNFLFTENRKGVYKVVSNGDHWARQYAGFSEDAITLDLSVHENKVLVSALDNGYKLALSNNEGSTWQPVPIPQLDDDPTDVALNEEGIYLLVDSTVYYTTDEGLNWQVDPVSTSLSGDNIHLSMYRGDVFIGVEGGFFALLAGTTGWELLEDQLFEGAIDQVFRWGDTYIAHSDLLEGYYYYSGDGGQSWKLTDEYPWYSSPALTEQGGVLFAAGHNLLNVSQDLGSSWVPRTTLLGFHETALHSFNGALYMATARGGVYRSLDEGESWERFSEGIYHSRPNYLHHTGVELLAGGVFGVVSYREDQWSDVSPFIQVGDGIYLEQIGNHIYTTIEGPMTDDFLYRFDLLSREWEELHEYEDLPFRSKVKAVSGLLYGWSGSTIYQSVDGGASFENFVVPVNSIRDLDGFGDELYVTGYKVVYKTDLAGQNAELLFNLNNTAYADHYLRNIFYTDGLMLLSAHNSESDLLLFSGDGGETWDALSGEVPYSEVETNGTNVELFEKHGDQLILVLRKGGIWQSVDGGENWSEFTNSYPASTILSAAIGDDKLFIGVKHEGVYEYQLQPLNTDVLEAFVYKDANNNRVQDAGEGGFRGVVLSYGESAFGATDVDGFANIVTDEPAGDTLKAYSTHKYSGIEPVVQAVDDFDSTYVFAHYYTPGIYDLSLDVTAGTEARPGHYSYYYLTLENEGTEEGNARLVLVPDARVEYEEATLEPDEIDGDTIKWLISDLPLFERERIRVLARVDENQVTIGDQLRHSARLEWIGQTDETPADNSFSWVQEVVAAVDPNDKQVDAGSELTTDAVDAGQKLKYTIRFQNVGNASALEVRVTDQLSENLDPTTFEVIAHSHDMSWTIGQKGLVEFVFENINLPDSATNELESHGFVKYAVAPRPDVEVGDFIHNEADIFFDFSSPITTNRVSTEIRMPLFTSEHREIGSLTLYPNPARDRIRLRLESDGLQKATVEFYDPFGRLQLSRHVTVGETDISLHGFAPGTYAVVLRSEGEMVAEGKVQVFR